MGERIHFKNLVTLASQVKSWGFFGHNLENDCDHFSDTELESGSVIGAGAH